MTHGSRLRLCLGSIPGKSFRVQTVAFERIGKASNILTAIIPEGWRKVGIISGNQGDDRFWIIEPGGVERAIEWEPFYVKGKFEIAEKINNARLAHESWKAFRPS